MEKAISGIAFSNLKLCISERKNKLEREREKREREREIDTEREMRSSWWFFIQSRPTLSCLRSFCRKKKKRKIKIKVFHCVCAREKKSC